jgi:type I restriction enzyme M protein
VIARFKLREELSKLVEANRLHALLDKFCDERINLSPYPVLDERGRVKLPALDNHTIGTIFEELIRKFNEAGNSGTGVIFPVCSKCSFLVFCARSRTDLVERPLAWI